MQRAQSKYTSKDRTKCGVQRVEFYRDGVSGSCQSQHHVLCGSRCLWGFRKPSEWWEVDPPPLCWWGASGQSYQICPFMPSVLEEVSFAWCCGRWGVRRKWGPHPPSLKLGEVDPPQAFLPRTAMDKHHSQPLAILALSAGNMSSAPEVCCTRVHVCCTL